MEDDLRLSIILPFMGQTRDRFQTFGVARSPAEQLARVAQVDGAGAVEIVYPYQLSDIPLVKKLLDDYGLACSTVNVNIKGEPEYYMGSLTSATKQVHDMAIQWLKEGMDVAAELGCNTVTVCPLGDGHDYAFQIDYTEAWGRFIEGIREAASHRTDVRLSLEYKPKETRAFVVMGSASSALHVCDQAGLPNVGLTIDIGHTLYGVESSALAIAQAAHVGRLFVVHINDNYRTWDWDLVPGSVNWWDWVETLLYLDRVGYGGWLVSDVMPARLDDIAVMNAVAKAIRRARRLLGKVDQDALWGHMRAGDALAAYDLLFSAMGLD